MLWKAKPLHRILSHMFCTLWRKHCVNWFKNRWHLALNRCTLPSVRWCDKRRLKLLIWTFSVGKKFCFLKFFRVEMLKQFRSPMKSSERQRKLVCSHSEQINYNCLLQKFKSQQRNKFTKNLNKFRVESFMRHALPRWSCIVKDNQNWN